MGSSESDLPRPGARSSEPANRAEGVASLLDSARARRIFYDSVTKAFSRFWLDGSKELQQGYLPNMRDVPKALMFQRDGDSDEKRLMQWFSSYDTAAKQAAELLAARTAGEFSPPPATARPSAAAVVFVCGVAAVLGPSLWRDPPQHPQDRALDLPLASQLGTPPSPGWLGPVPHIIVKEAGRARP